MNQTHNNLSEQIADPTRSLIKETPFYKKYLVTVIEPNRYQLEKEIQEYLAKNEVNEDRYACVGFKDAPGSVHDFYLLLERMDGHNGPKIDEDFDTDVTFDTFINACCTKYKCKFDVPYWYFAK